jgi:hypothetical protein
MTEDKNGGVSRSKVVPRGLAAAFDDEMNEVPASAPVPRSEMRSSMREESPLERAKRRAAEIRGHIGDIDEGTDEFYIPQDMIPEGWTYEWKRKLLLGAEDPSYTVHLARMGWEAVPLNRDSDHQAMMPPSWPHNTIERKGMILMERPTEVVQEARRIDQKRARDQVRAKEAQLAGAPDGQFSRDHAQVRPKISKSFEAMPIPEE